jgi:hypothetical protein
MTSNLGQKLMIQSGSSVNGQPASPLTLSTSSSTTLSSQWIGTPVGGLGNNGTTTITTTGGTYTTANYDTVTLWRTLDNEFVINGPEEILMEYFMQSPEKWLRLAAMYAEEKANGTTQT